MWPVVNVVPCPRKCHTSVDARLCYLSREDRNIGCATELRSQGQEVKCLIPASLEASTVGKIGIGDES